MAISPPAGTVARPAIGGVRPTLQGTVTVNTQTASNVVKLLGFNLSTGAATGLTNAGVTINGVTVNLGSVVTTTGAAISVTGSNNGATAGNSMTFVSVSANGGTNGILLGSGTGSFTVTGTGSAGSGGTIQNTTGRGASFSSAQNVSLTNMNFTNTAITDLDADNSGLTTGDNLATNAAIHLERVTTVTLNGIIISGSSEQGINGHFVTGFALRNSSLSGTGNGPDEDGLHFYNMLGTCDITNTTFTSSGDDNINIQNNTNLSFPSGMTAVTSLTVSGGSANTGVLGSGYLIGIRGTSTATVTISGVTANNNFSGGIVIDTFDTATSTIEITGVTSTSNNDAISLSSNNGNTKFDIHDNVSFAGTDFVRISILKAAFSTVGTLQGFIRNNPIVVSDGQTADGISIFQAGDGVLTVAIQNNDIDYRGTQRAINIQGGQDGSGQLNATVTGNTIDMQIDGTGNPTVGILAQVAVASPSGDNTNMCANIGGAGGLANIFTHSLGGNMAAGDIRLRQRFVTTVSLPGYAGSASDNAAVVAYLASRNTLVNSPTATATNEIGVTPGAGGFVNAGACTLPVFP